MGGGSSTTKATFQEVGEVDNSSGFHLIEVHTPSMGIGIGSVIFTIVFAGIAIIILRKCYKKCWDTMHQQVWRWLTSEPLLPYWPNPPMPMAMLPQHSYTASWRYSLPALSAPLPSIEMAPPTSAMHEDHKNKNKQKYNWEV